MGLSSNLRRAQALFALASVFAAGAAADVIDLPGATSATLSWAPADGPVVGYYVVVVRNGGLPTVQQIAGQEQTTLTAETGEELVVYVAAFDETGQAGPVSPPSPTLRFLPASTTGGGGDDPTSSDPPSTGDGDPPAPDDPTHDPLPAAERAVPFDYTGDGLSDLLVSAGGDVWLYVMQAASIVEHVDLPELGAGWSIAGHGDYDGNGSADLLWREDATGALYVWLLRDAALIDSALLDLAQLGAPDAWQVAGSHDMGGDGRDDILLQSTGGEVAILHMHGTGVASSDAYQGPGSGLRVAALADVDGDGAAEIVWIDDRERRLRTWDFTTTGVTTSVLASSRSWQVIGAGDFDGDGREDIFVRRHRPDGLAVWLVDGGSVREVVALPSVARSWSLSAAGDYDGDRRTDLFWYDVDASTGEIWFSDGTAVTRETVQEGTGAATLTSDGSQHCAGDFDGNGTIDFADLTATGACLADPTREGCALADIDGDGAITEDDFYRQRERLGWPACDSDGP